MDINWFPGHMAKSTREIENNVKISDCVLYVLDCRAVRSCFNPAFDKLITVPVVYALNKADTVPAEVADGWRKKLSENGFAVTVSGVDAACRKLLLATVKRACAPTLERQKKRGLNEHVRVTVIGVPNTGKSTIINSKRQGAARYGRPRGRYACGKMGARGQYARYTRYAGHAVSQNYR